MAAVCDGLVLHCWLERCLANGDNYVACVDFFPQIWQVNGMLLAGQKVYVGPFLKKSDRPVDKESRFTNVYVKNLPDSVDDKKLNEMFSEHGSVTSAVVMKVAS